MVESKNYKIHFVALASLFILGNTVIVAPQNGANEYNFFAFLLSVILAVCICFLGFLIPLNRLSGIFFWAISIFCVGDSLITFIRFIKQNLLPQTPAYLIALPFLALVAFLGLKKEDIILKFSLFAIVPTVFIILLFFLSTAKDFEFRNIFIYSLPNIRQLLNQLLFYVKGLVLPCFIISAFAKMHRFKKGTLFGGFTLGVLLLAFTVLNSVLLFGIEFSGALNYPYSSAGSTVTFGDLFTRLDGFLYFVFLCSCVIKCMVGIYVIKKSRSVIAP